MKNRILFIEDDPIIRENSTDILEFANYEVVQAVDGKQGVELARITQPDLILCDIQMPKLDGYAVYQLISNDDYLKNIPFIFISSHNSYEDIRKAMSLGADDFLKKPYEESELLNAISTRLKKTSNLRNQKTNVENPVEYKNIEELINSFLHRTAQNYLKNETIYCEDNLNNYLYLVKSGTIKTYKNTEDGKELITGFYYPNNFLGYLSLFGEIPHTEHAAAIEDAKLIKIEKQEIISILESHPHLTLKLLKLLANRFKDSKDKMLQMAYDSVKGRIAKTLLSLAKNNGQDHICISRSDLANLTGIAKETLIRNLSEFKESNLISIEKNNLKIIDSKKLSTIC